MKYDKQALEYNENTHANTIITTSNQTTLDSHKLDIKAIWLGIVPVKLLLERSK
jgi:hypothetical protein